MLEHSLGELRSMICPDGLDSFNYKKFEGKNISIDDFEGAIDTLPAFADRTLIEVHDFDIFKGKSTGSTGSGASSDKERLCDIFSHLPEYVCVVVVFSTIQYKPDNRIKLDKEILSHCLVVEFAAQDQSRLTNWISRRFAANGKRISKSDTEYLAHITDGYMSALITEIEKISSFSNEQTISRSDIDSVVIPVLGAFAYTLTDAILEGNSKKAMFTLDELLQMREPAQKILFSIILKMRQFLAARICIENGLDRKSLMEMCSIRLDFQARTLMNTAQKTSLTVCRNALLHCVKAAYDLNSSAEPEERLVELIVRLSYLK